MIGTSWLLRRLQSGKSHNEKIEMVIMCKHADSLLKSVIMSAIHQDKHIPLWEVEANPVKMGSSALGMGKSVTCVVATIVGGGKDGGITHNNMLQELKRFVQDHHHSSAANSKRARRSS